MGNSERRMRNREGAGGRSAFAVRNTPWRRFIHDRLTQVSALLLAAFLVTSIGTLLFALQWYNVQELDVAVRHPPAAAPAVAAEHFALVDGAPAAPTGPRGLTPAARIAHRASSWFGHDDLGRSLFYRVLPGFLVSLAIGLAAAGVAVVIGVTFGAVAALIGGRVDLVMMRIVDVIYGLPYILMVILLKIALTRPLTAVFAGHTRYADIVILFLAIGGVSWLTMARVIRGQVLSLRSQPFVEAARAAGAGPFYILWRHVLPNLIGPIMQLHREPLKKSRK